MDCEKLLNADSLSEALAECRYSIEEDDNGNVFDIWFIGEKLGGDFNIFLAIAPVVENGSYIEMRGEEGDLWRWVVNDGVCKEITPTIIWEDN